MNLRMLFPSWNLPICTLAIGCALPWLCIGPALAQDSPAKPKSESVTDAGLTEANFLSKTRQLTFEGVRAGEGYFSRDGKSMVFQSERDKENPFYQIYLMDRETGDMERVSSGYGKTTCAWIHPDGDRVLFASTQFDPESIKKQRAEIEERASGKQKRYAWDYDEHFDLVEWNRKTHQYKKITNIQGYDAEASYSPDGQYIAFSSNRLAYQSKLSEREKTLFENDPATALDLYIMKSDGTEVKRITDQFGYDGGPFFSPDGKRLCWRRFSEDGATAEIYTANLDGTAVKRLQADPTNPKEVGANMPGMVVTVAVKTGDKIAKGQKLFTLEAMKMETTISSEVFGVVEKVLVKPGSRVEAGDLLLTVG